MVKQDHAALNTVGETVAGKRTNDSDEKCGGLKQEEKTRTKQTFFATAASNQAFRKEEETNRAQFPTTIRGKTKKGEHCAASFSGANPCRSHRDPTAVAQRL